MEKTKQLEQLLQKEYGNTGAVLVWSKGKRVFEYYAEGCDETSPFHVFSVTKSVLSLLFGIAMEKGYITDVSQPILTFFPDYKVQKKEKTIQKIALKDMLTMTAPYKYIIGPYRKFFSSEDWVTASLDLLGGRGKIGKFRYAPLIGPDIFSGILRNTTGQSVREFANENLFRPLGTEIPQDIYFESEKEQMEFYESRNVRGWVVDGKGVNTGGWGLILTPQIMEQIGVLLVNQGSYDGKQLVPGSWIKEMTTPKSSWKKMQYGYLWWIIDEREHSFAALGDGGNAIYVNPDRELVVICASYFEKKTKDRVKLIKEVIEPIFS